MGAILPKAPLARVEFCEAHVGVWSGVAVGIGTTAAAVTDLTTKTTAARAKFALQQAAQNAAKAATADYHLAVDAMTDAASDILKQVKAKAATGGDAVYVLAAVPAPLPPSPKAAPGKPTDFTVALDDSGALNLGWKCANPAGAQGTIYQVWRRVGAAGEFAYLGGAGTKKFVDATLPSGSSSVTYQIQAVRSTAVGPWAQFNVNFGVGGVGGMMMASVVEGVPAKIAA